MKIELKIMKETHEDIENAPPPPPPPIKPMSTFLVKYNAQIRLK